MSIVDETRQPTEKPQGKYWVTRVPTTPTILQVSSTGLPVDPLDSLPIFPEDDPNFRRQMSVVEENTSDRYKIFA